MARGRRVSWPRNSNPTRPRHYLKAITSPLRAPAHALGRIVFRRPFLLRFALVAAALVITLGDAGSLHAQAPLKREPLALITSTGEHEFSVEIATTREQQSRGLMFRRSLGPREGMLFVYDGAQYVSMWMRNTYISLDMIFIRPDGRVHRIEQSTEPLSERIIESGERVNAVLEVAAGTATRLQLKPGDTVRHAHFKSP